jgi:hypothetical protein
MHDIGFSISNPSFWVQLGLEDKNLFETIDLFEAKDMARVRRSRKEE